MELVSFRIYSNRNSAIDLSSLLKKNDIFNELIENKSSLDSSFSSSLLDEYEVKIAQNDFVKAEKVLLNDLSGYLESLPKDYYLFSFLNNELLEIIERKDEWSDLDYLLANNLLKSRGVEVSNEFISEVNSKRIFELKKPEVSSKKWISVGYAFALFGGFFRICYRFFASNSKENATKW